MTDRCCARRGVHTHIGRYHILQGVDLAVPRGRLTMLLGRNGAGKTTTLRTIMGLWQASAGAVAFDGADIERTATPDIARARHRLCAGKHGHLLRSHGAGKPRARGPRGAASTTRGWTGFSACFRRCKRFWLLAAGIAVRRPEADARDRPRHRRAAQAAADRRTDQGPRARDHRQHVAPSAN